MAKKPKTLTIRPVACACGCGALVWPVVQERQYVNANHRMRALRERRARAAERG